MTLTKTIKGGMEQSTREVMVHSFLPARSSYLRFTCFFYLRFDQSIANAFYVFS